MGSGGVITNIGYESGSVTSGEDSTSIGSFAARTSGGTITNSYSKATLNGTAAAFISPTVGGLVGRGDNVTISNSYYSGDITNATINRMDTGGIAGYLSAGSVTNSYSSGNITGGQNVGGIAGRLLSSSTISSSFATMTFTNASFVGGIVGVITSGTITNGYFNDSIGGFIPMLCYSGGDTGCTRIEKKYSILLCYFKCTNG